MAKYKATIWLPVYEYIKSTLTDEEFENFKKTLPNDVRLTLFDNKIIPVSWLDVALIVTATNSYWHFLGKSRYSFESQMEMSRFVQRKNFNGIYRFFMSFLVSPAKMCEKYKQLWSTYCDFGQLHVQEVGKKEAILLITDATDIPQDHYMGECAGICAMLEIAGMKNVHYKHVKCLARNDEHCKTIYSWS